MLEVIDEEGERQTVFIMSASSKGGSGAAGACYKLYKKLSDPYGMDHREDCDEVFKSKAAAAKYAKELIESYEVFFGEDSFGESYGEVPVDKRDDPPDKGVLLQVCDMEGETQTIYIVKVSG